MDEHSVLDLPALTLGFALSLCIAIPLIAAHGGDNRRRAWMVGGALMVLLAGLGVMDLLRGPHRDTHLATVVFGATLPVVGTIGVIRLTRRVAHRWIRWPLIVLTTVLLLFAGLLIGATLVPRFLSI